jgi:hypothetical protein
METKPYNLQSPEQIAKDYGGNKQKIAEAMQMGVIDPTAGTLAGMFIDRMRSAAQAEATPQQSVAQQTFAPAPPPEAPAPAAPPMGAPAGLGATPEAAAMPPMDAMPPMGATPPMDVAPPQGEMPMMAEGGMVPPYMSGGGLSDLPVPDGMFDEPSNGGFGDGYAGGGMVAFAAGDEVDADEDGDGSPDTYFGYNYKDPSANAAMRDKLFGVPETKYANEYEADLLKRRSPEAMKAARKKDINMALIEAGIAMANTPGSLLQSATRGIGAALPGFKAAEKERRAEEREIQKGLMDLEQGRNTVAAQKAMQLIEMQRTGIQGREGQIGREFQEKQQLAGFAQQTKENALDRDLQRYGYSMRGRGDGSSGGSSEKPLSPTQAAERVKGAKEDLDEIAKNIRASEQKGTHSLTYDLLSQYANARTAFNNAALLAGRSPITTTKFPTNLPKFNAYLKAEKAKRPTATASKPTKTMSLADQIIAGNKN